MTLKTKPLGTVYCGANDCAPSKCHCGAKLARPTHGYVEIEQRTPTWRWQTPEADKIGQCWHIVCKCNARYVWAWDGEGNGARNGRWYVYPVWPMNVRKALPDNGKKYLALEGM